MKRFLQLITMLLLVGCQTATKKTNSLQNDIEQILADKKAIVGVSVNGFDGNELVAINVNKRFPLQSVFKYHIALTMLSQIDEGKFSLDQKIEIQKKDLLPDLWSPLRDENPNGGKFKISKLIEYSISYSDNVGCDILLRLLGGPLAVENYIKKNNIKDISVKLNEETMQSNWDLMYQNWITPKAANQSLITFFENKNKVLSKKSHEFIWKVMKETDTGENRLKGGLPKGTAVAHKTGSSGTNKKGITEAVNDIGIVFLPNGKYFFISVFVTNSEENQKTNEKIIADIAKAAWYYYTSKTK